MISKILPMKMAENRKMISTPQRNENLTNEGNVAHGWNMVKRIEMRVCGKSLPRRDGGHREEKKFAEQAWGAEDCDVRSYAVMGIG
jgi:hypothetical protein